MKEFWAKGQKGSKVTNMIDDDFQMLNLVHGQLEGVPLSRWHSGHLE